MSIFDRYPQPSLNVDDMISLLWRKLCKVEHDVKLPDINHNTNTTINNFPNTAETLTPHRHARLIFDKETSNYAQLQSSCEDDYFIYCPSAHNLCA